MTTKVEMFRSKSANVFDTEHGSLRDDLCGLLVDSQQLQKPIAEKLVEHLCGSHDGTAELADLFKRLRDTHPSAPRSSEPVKPVIQYTGPPHVCQYQPIRGEQIARCTVCNAPAFDHRRPPQPIGSAQLIAPTDEPKTTVCQVPPHPFNCTRLKGHSGPCATVRYDRDEV